MKTAHPSVATAYGNHNAENLRSNKSTLHSLSAIASSQSNGGRGSSSIAGAIDCTSNSVDGCSSSSGAVSNTSYKFTSIVNKVESLISKMNNDKLNNFRADLAKGNGCNQCEHEKLQNNMKRASLDSLNNLTDADSFEESNDRIYTDSDDAEIAHITGTTAVQVHPVHRRSDLDQLTNESIREFNEQCSSLSCDVDFENVWSVGDEDDVHQQTHHNKHSKQQVSKHMTDQEKCCLRQCCAVPQDLHLPQYGFSLNRGINRNDYQKDRNNNQNNLSKINVYHRIEPFNSNHSDFTECGGDGDEMKNTSNKIDLQIMQNNLKNSSNQNQYIGNGDNIEICNINSSSNYSHSNSNIVGAKIRRSSIASSGSVGRMETIIEEPTDSKISVKEILARFETLSNETQSKASTLSSGARAAAQILNVPLERLEPRQTNQRDSSSPSNIPSPTGIANGHSPIGHHGSSNAYTSSNIRHEGDANEIDHIQSKSVHQHRRNSHNDLLDSQDIPVKQGHHEDEMDVMQSNHSHNRIDGMHPEHIERQQYNKQSSFLHSTRKVSGAQQNAQYREHGPMSVQHLDANYMTEDPNSGTPPSVTKYSLLQFAMQHFRNDQISDQRLHNREAMGDRSDRRSSSNRSYADLVKWQGMPISTPLLRLPNDLAPLALECFDCILHYCGDINPDPELTEVKCVYTVLMHCHKYLALRDEVYCQLMKQTTANRSPCPDSSQRAWRLLSILAAYFGCSDALRPYLMEHLTSAASDRRRTCHGTSAVCLTNLRKTARCGGRKNVPSVEEVTAVSAGRSARRQIYRLPGGAERVVNTRCSTVVADVISELCALLGVESEAEQQEFSLYCIVQGDAFTMPLAADEYILDVTTELLKSGQPFYLIFCRSVWHFPLKRDPAPTPLYIEVLFNQVAPDYLEGLLLELPVDGVTMDVIRDMGRIAALLHRAADLTHVPAMKEIKFLLPKPALGIRDLRPTQWVGLVQSSFVQIAGLTPSQVKAQFLNVLSAWPLFGSSFFAVKRIWAEEGPHVEESSPIWRDLILALNRRGVLFLDPNTHETLQHWPFMEVISTRKVRSEDGALFLDMKVGNLMQQRVIRVQTEQAHEISRLVRQYITMAQISQRDKRDIN